MGDILENISTQPRIEQTVSQYKTSSHIHRFLKEVDNTKLFMNDMQMYCLVAIVAKNIRQRHRISYRGSDGKVRCQNNNRRANGTIARVQ